MFVQLFNRAIIRNVSARSTQSIHTTVVNTTFWEREKKSGYAKKYPLVPTKAMILEGLQELKKEIILWKDEVKEKLEGDPICVFRPGEVDIAWKFSGWLRDTIGGV